MGEQRVGTKPLSILGYIRERWNQVLEPALSQATTDQIDELEKLWGETLNWLQEERHLRGDSLRKPLSQIRKLIETLPVHDGNAWREGRSRKVEHVAYHIFTLPEEEWERLNARSQLSLEERLRQQQFLVNTDAIVNRGLVLMQSADWTEILVGAGLGTGRRFWELVKTGSFVEKTPYSITFKGQAKRPEEEEEEFEIPTLYRAFLVIEGLRRLRRMIDWEELVNEYSPLYQRYNKAANEAVVRHLSELLPVRPNREQLNFHVLRAVYARIATYWYAPPEVADIAFMAEIQGHWEIKKPQVLPGEDEVAVKKKQLNYAANANYFDYKIGRVLPDGSYQLVGEQGIRLGQPGVVRLEAFPEQRRDQPPANQSQEKAKVKKESTSLWAPLTVKRHTRAWFRDLSGGQTSAAIHQSEQDDLFLRKLLTAYYLVGGGLAEQEIPVAPLSIDLLDISERVRELLRQTMALAGTTDILAFLLEMAQPEMQRMLEQEASHEGQTYEPLATSELRQRREEPGARQELYRRGLYAVMQYNQTHTQGERWFLSDRALQALVGGRKDSIKAFKEANSALIEAHHREFEIREGFNRKPGNPRIEDKIVIPDDAADFPWNQHA